MTEHYWQGQWIDDSEAFARLPRLGDHAAAVAAFGRLRPRTVLAACERLTARLSDAGQPLAGRLHGLLEANGVPTDEADRTLSDLRRTLDRGALETKLQRELGGADPDRLSRFDFRREVFEAWLPIGLLVHVAPGNAPAAAALSVVEGLLSGNLNAVKTSGEGRFTHELLAALAEADPTGAIARHLIVLGFPSERAEWLRRLCAAADGIAVWGNEEAVTAVTALAPPGCRVVDWGPKLSFVYLDRGHFASDPVLAAVAEDVCRLDQQACASPQVVYLDTDDVAEVHAFAERFAAVLGRQEPSGSAREPAESAEVTNTVLVARHEELIGLTSVHAAPDGAWHVIADTRSALRASPLHRTVWVKPLPRGRIGAVLRPMRRYLQTCGVGADRVGTAKLATMLLSAGVQRITVPGRMLDSYPGEPHDGVYALQRYSRRVAANLDERFATDAALGDLTGHRPLPVPDVRVTAKDGFERLQEGSGQAEVFFRSGGSSGAPKLSAFTWDDYHEHMRYGAEGILAAGFDPARDRAMNLFFGGLLYGGFPSFFSVLETLGAVQFPMAAQSDHALVARSIVEHRVDTLFGMPNYLLQVFAEGTELLRGYRGVRKVFYGGEHFPPSQRHWLREEFGVEVVRAAAYGSVDAGPLGYQCSHVADRVYHLFGDLHAIEVLAAGSDRPADVGEVGRLVFTSPSRRGQRLERYEIGDLGRLVTGPCPCGRLTPRFELLGRFGDVFRSGSHFLNYRRITEIAEEHLAHRGAVQVVLDENASGQESLGIHLEGEARGHDPDAAEVFLTVYRELAAAVVRDRLVSLRVYRSPSRTLTRSPASGKLLSVVDRRARNT